MKRCLTCGEPIQDVKGHRPKKYCNSLCKQRDWQRKNRRHVKKTAPAETTPPNENDAILKQIEAIRKETVPYYRDTPIGRKTWSADQEKRIIELEKKLK